MRVALYGRFSSDDEEQQNQRSAQDQLAALRAKALERGWMVVAEIADEGVSGSAIGNRPGIQELLRRAAGGEFDIVFAEALDRISRGQADTARIYELLSFYGVQLETLTSGTISELHIGLEGTMNRLFLVGLAHKTRRGLIAKVKAGFSGGGHCYGYRIPGKGLLEVDPEQAVVVRRIFAEYARGVSPRAIAYALNAERIPGPRGGEWTASSINGDRRAQDGILHQELYVGVRVFNRRRFRKHPETGRRSSVLNPPEQWIREPVPDLRILDDEAWRAVQAVKAELSTYQARGPRPRPKYLLSGLVACASCGSPMILQGPRFACTRRRERGTCDNASYPNAAKVEKRVLDGFREHLMNPAYVKRYLRDFQAELQADQLAAATRQASNERELAEVQRRIGRAWEAYDDGVLPKSAFGERIRELEGRKIRLEAEISAAEADQRVVTMHPGAADVYASLVEDLHAALQGEDAAEARAAFRPLVDQVLLGPAEGRGQFTVLVRAKTSALFEGSKRANAFGPKSSSVVLRMGAGTRSDRQHHNRVMEFAA